MYPSNGARESTPPQNRQLIVLISDRKIISWRFRGDVDFQRPFD